MRDNMNVVLCFSNDCDDFIDKIMSMTVSIMIIIMTMIVHSYKNTNGSTELRTYPVTTAYLIIHTFTN